MQRVLVVDDKDNVRHLLTRILEPRFAVSVAADGDEAERLLEREPFDVVLSDLRMPGKDGLEVLRIAKALSPATEVVLMTAFASVQSAVEAIRAGAFDYLPKPFDPDEALLKIERAAERKSLRDRNSRLERDLEELLGRARFGQLIGRSEAMQRLFALLDKAAARDLTVLLLGESGTGKELAARAIHERGPRRAAPFLPVNCGALPATLMESELFGHKKGAFTGADGDRPGGVGEAAGGTVFLDEIGELPLGLQVKLNRALQERELRRVGETITRRFEARVIAATHRDLPAMIAAGELREDLYYRLNVFPIALPSLRDRKEDIPLLARHFLALARAQGERALPLGGALGFTPDALAALIAHDWPGNVRELENAVVRAVALADGEQIGLADLPPEIGEAASGPARVLAGSDPLDAALLGRFEARVRDGARGYREAMARVEAEASRAYLEELMRRHAGNVSRAAVEAGLARESLHRLLRRHAIEPARFR